MLTDVIQLLNHDGAVLVTTVGDFPKVRDDRVVAVPEIASRQNRIAVNRNGFNHNHRGATDRPFQVVAVVARDRQTVHRHIGGVSAEVKPVLQCLVPDVNRVEQVLELGGLRSHDVIS